MGILYRNIWFINAFDDSSISVETGRLRSDRVESSDGVGRATPRRMEYWLSAGVSSISWLGEPITHPLGHLKD